MSTFVGRFGLSRFGRLDWCLFVLASGIDMILSRIQIAAFTFSSDVSPRFIPIDVIFGFFLKVCGCWFGSRFFHDSIQSINLRMFCNDSQTSKRYSFFLVLGGGIKSKFCFFCKIYTVWID